MVCEAVGAPLVGRRRYWPTAKKPTDVVIEVCACGVCRTDLHVVDGDLPRRAPEIVPGHEVVGVFMKNWEDDDTDEYCTSREDLASWQATFPAEAIRVSGALYAELIPAVFDPAPLQEIGDRLHLRRYLK